jgi:hypothetical protein
MIAAQQNPAEYKFPQGDPLETVAAKLGAEILLVAIDFDQILMTRIARSDAIGRLKRREDIYNTRFLPRSRIFRYTPRRLCARKFTFGR